MKRIINVSGKMGSGKTTTLNKIVDKLESLGVPYKKIKFADPLYEMHNYILEYMESYGLKYNGVKHGPLLQYMGTEFGRNTYGDNVWVDIARNKIENLPKNTIAIIDDMRFKNEFEAFSDALKIRLEADKEIRKARCENWRENDNHQSEIDLDDWIDRFDLVYETDKDKSADEIAEEIIFYLMNS